MAAPVLDLPVDTQSVSNESAVWDVYRALCGALLRSDRTEVWTLLTNPELRASNVARSEDSLFRAAAFLLVALRMEAAGESPSSALKNAHALLREAISLSGVRLW